MLWVLGVLVFLLCAGAIGQIVRERKVKKELIAPGKIVTVSSGSQLHVYAKGEGPRAVILSGWGVGVPCMEYRPMADELAKRGYRAVIVEKPGYGFTSETDAPRDIDTVVNEIHDALKAAGEGAPYLLLGHSLAGTEILRFACLWPKEIKGLVSIDAPAPLCYMSLPTPGAAAVAMQGAMRFFGIFWLMARTNVTKKYYQKMLNGYKLMTPEERTVMDRILAANGSNKCVRSEIKALKENCQKAGDQVPEGIKLVMLLSSDTKERLYEKLLPCEDEYIAKNSAPVYVVEGKHNLQQFAPDRIAELTATEFPIA